MKYKKIAWITADYFLDVDISIVPFLQSNNSLCNIDWFIIRSCNSNIPVSEQSVSRVFQLKYRGKDPRTMLQYYCILRQINISDYDMVYSNVVGVPYYYPVLLNIKKTVPVIHAAHNVIPYELHKKVWTRTLRRGVKYVFENNQYFHLFSRFTYDYFLTHYPDKNAFYAPMTLKSYGEVRTNNYKVDINKVNLLFFGKVMENKRLDVLINAVKRLPMAIKKRVNLTIAGECTTPDFYYNLIGEESCISAYFRRIADEEVPELFFKHKYLVLPYEEVAQSGPHMIAYNYNLPVIASSIKGFTERIKDGETGFLFNVNDVASLANVIVKVADLSSDEYVLLKENLCRYTEEEYDLKKIACRYETFFDFVAKQY